MQEEVDRARFVLKCWFRLETTQGSDYSLWLVTFQAKGESTLPCGWKS